MANILTYDGGVVPSGSGSKFKKDRLFLLDNSVAKDLNTYKNWRPFGAISMPIFDNNAPGTNGTRGGMKDTTNISVKSLFNNSSSVGYNQKLQVRSNAPLLDTPSLRMEMRKTQDCSIKALVDASSKGLLGFSNYTYADFMYCKHLGKISNNHLITLRRFPKPSGDHINYTDPFDSAHQDGSDTEKHGPDIGRLITWMGTPGNEMSNILKYTVKMPFKKLDSQIESGGDPGGDSGGPLGTFLNATTSTNYQEAMKQGYAGASTFRYLSGITSHIPFVGGKVSNMFSNSNPPYTDLIGFQDRNKTYGPIDVLAWTHIRDTGLEFNHQIKLTFNYELRSYNGINGKAAMLDLLANILAVCYSTGPFWGGAYRFTGMSQSNVFANLPIFNMKPGAGSADYLDAAIDSGKSILSSISGGASGSGNILDTLKGVLSTLGKGLFSAFLGAGLNQLGRPHKQGLNSLLSPAPVGPWHLTVGNPWHPILSIGNLIMEDAEIEHYGPLGLDDFPTGLKVTVTLIHAKPRDNALIESMYLMGESRIYTPADSEVMNMYNGSSDIGGKGTVSSAAKKYSKNKTNMDLTNGAHKEEKEVIRSQGFVETSKELLQWSWDGLKSKTNEMKSVLKKHFGTSDPDIIVHTSQEAGFGSQKETNSKKK